MPSSADTPSAPAAADTTLAPAAAETTSAPAAEKIPAPGVGPDSRFPGYVGDRAASALALLLIYRIIYHSYYLLEVPFALATFSDGRQYELSAADIVQHPILGTMPFYLQGAYAYFMAGAMALWSELGAELLLQLVLAACALFAFGRAVRHFFGVVPSGWALVVLLAYPMLAFYENKFLTASLTVGACIAVLWTFARARQRLTLVRVVLVGAAVAMAILFRPNLALLVVFVGWALVVLARIAGKSKPRVLLQFGLGLALCLAPMALRNLAVTGQATVFPAHGGGTSFYIGNNHTARGVWNSAGGLLSGDVTREREELREALGVAKGSDTQEIAAIGDALYQRAFTEIAAEPGRWLWLEVRKFWLMVGNDELTQDYDLYGEQELVGFAHRVGIPFGVLAVFGVLGGLGLVRRIRLDRDGWLPLGLVVLGLVVSTLAANLLYFTSSQHRLPLVVPLAFLVPCAWDWCRDAVAKRRYVALAIVAVCVGLTFIPRSKLREPSAVHYFNLSVAWLSLDQPHEALAALEAAMQRRPEHPVIRIERATLYRKLGQTRRAQRDLHYLEQHAAPAWVRQRIEREWRVMGGREHALRLDGVEP